MADAFGIAAGVVGVLGLVIQITQVVTEFGLDWKDAPADVEGFRRELQSLKTVLSETNTNLLLNPDFKEAFEDRRSALLSELGPDAPPAAETALSIKSCKDELEALLDDLKKRGKGHRMGWERLKSAFLNKRAQSSVDKLRHQCEIFNNMVSIDTMTLGVINHKEIKRARQEQKEWHNLEQNQKILTWLSNLNFDEKQRDILSKRHPGTGRWLLNSDTFRAWRNGHDESPSTLWCPGIPGAGKSVMTSIVVESLQEMFVGEDVSISFAYCDYKDRSNQKTVSLVSSLVKQMVSQQKDMPEEVISLYSAHGHGQNSLSLAENLSLLSSFLNSFRRSFILIDALDEHFTNEDEENVLQLPLLQELLKLQRDRSNSKGYTLFFTSRENHVIREQLAGCGRLDIRAADADIESYIRSRIADLSQFRFANKIQEDAQLANTIVERLIEKAQGMFLLPRLHLDRLGCQTSIRKLRDALDSLPTRLNETYEEAMNRIKGQVQEHSELAMSALAWISNALRPLTLVEMKVALAIQPGDSELDEEAKPEEALIVSVSAGLITIDLESETMRLVHFTVEEYFRGLKHRWFPRAHSQIAEICLTYLSFDVFDSGRSLEEEDYLARLKKNSLLEYAALNWGLHAARAEHDISKVALGFLLNNRKVSCASQILMQEDIEERMLFGFLPYDFPGLHLAAYFGLASLAKRYLEAEPAVNPKDSHGRTPLSWAAARGQEAVVKLLLNRHDIVADSQDDYGQTPLSWAAENGHISVVKLLLDRDDVMADHQDKHGRTPLSRAAKEGEEVVVKLLLDRDDVVADSQDDYGQTPLSRAAARGKEAVVKLLLDRDDVVADSCDKYGRTPLSWAAENGQEAVVKLLLDRDDVVADSQDEDGRTPLSWAAENGREAVVKLLLDRDDVVADSQNKDGRTPLSWAAAYGQNAVVKLLLDRDDVMADHQDKSGRTPLLWAAARGQEAGVKLLLDRDDVVADSCDKYGRTPLSWAAENGQEAVVKLLLDRDDVVADHQDKSGRTPLSWAAGRGEEAVVKLLLLRVDVMADSQDIYGRTPLSWASEAWDGKNVAKLLLDRENVAADSKDKELRTPLYHAIINGRKEIVKLLLDRDDVAADYQDSQGDTLLDHAVIFGHNGIIELLKKKLRGEEMSESSDSVVSSDSSDFEICDSE